MIEITVFPILAAGFANIILGFIWYHPKVLGSTWMRLINLSPEMVERGKKHMHIRVGTAFLTSLLAAYVLNFIGIALGVYDTLGAIQLAFICWIGFVVPTFISTVLWEQRPVKLYIINTSYWLASLVVMALILLY